MKKKKVLIFYSKTGGGHLRAAEAIAQYLKDAYPNLQVYLSDGLEKTSFGLKINPIKFFNLLSIKLLPFYNTIYLLTNNPLGIKILRLFIKIFWGQSFRIIIKQENPSVIISTHHFISPQTLGRNSIPFITMVTDLGIPHKIWFDTRSNLILAPTDQILSQAQQVTGSKCHLANYGYPLKKAFISKIISKNIKNTILILGSGAKTRRLKQQVKHLLVNLPNHNFIVVCGFNKSLEKNLLNLEKPNLKVYGFINNIDYYMKKADIIIGKAGPGVIAEAANLNKPLIITDWVGLQEKGNIDFVLKNYLGVYCPKINKLTDTVKLLYSTYSIYSNINKQLRPNYQAIAKAIYSYL